MDLQDQQHYLNTVRDMADDAAYDYTEDQLLAMAMANIGEYITDNSPRYILIDEDPRNQDDYDSWTYGMEVLPEDHTWQSKSIDIDVSPNDADVTE
jgi:hypothetical protein